MKKRVRVAIVGATGAVGRELLSILDQRKFPIEELRLFASSRSKGNSLQWQSQSYPCQTLEPECFREIDIAFFDASDAVSARWVIEASEAGAWVVDNSSTYRLQNDILLLVPEVNGELLERRISESRQRTLSAKERILSGPNCAALPLTMVLKPIQNLWGLKRVVVSTYQSVSGAGTAALKELTDQTSGVLNGTVVPPRIFPHPIAFNCIPFIGSIGEDSYTSEEEKIIQESRKILNLPHLKLSATAVRVPTVACHSESVNIEFEKSFDLNQVREALSSQPGIILLDNPERGIYPLSVSFKTENMESATGKDHVYVGRIRRDFSVPHGINLWLVSDNLRKGAALNAVQLGEVVLKSFE